MRLLFNHIYCSVRRKELEKAIAQVKKINVDTILQRLTKLCWKNNIQYKVLIKTREVLIMELIGSHQLVLFKYHKSELVSREEVDFFMGSIDENKAEKGVYITTGVFEGKNKIICERKSCRRDVILEDCFSFAKAHIGIRGKAVRDFRPNKLNLFKYLPQ
jgi:hypothetical protein